MVALADPVFQNGVRTSPLIIYWEGVKHHENWKNFGPSFAQCFYFLTAP